MVQTFHLSLIQCMRYMYVSFFSYTSNVQILQIQPGIPSFNIAQKGHNKKRKSNSLYDVISHHGTLISSLPHNLLPRFYMSPNTSDIYFGGFGEYDILSLLDN